MTGEALQQRLSRNLKNLRKGKFTQEELAEAAGISSQMVNNIEGQRRWPSETTLVKIADALCIDVYQLFVPTPDESSQTQALYKAVSDKLINIIRKSVNETLDKLSTERN